MKIVDVFIALASSRRRTKFSPLSNDDLISEHFVNHLDEQLKIVRKNERW